jgi:hypothetical protein
MNDFGATKYDPYKDLPEDPEAAFLELEAYYKAECDSELFRAQSNNERTDTIHVHYMAQVLGAINELGLEHNFKSDVPSIEDVDYNTYLNFNKMWRTTRPCFAFAEANVL